MKFNRNPTTEKTMFFPSCAHYVRQTTPGHRLGDCSLANVRLSRICENANILDTTNCFHAASQRLDRIFAFKQKYRLYRIVVLVIMVIILISGCVEKPTEKPINSRETEEKPVEEPIEEPQKEVNTTMEEHEKIINDTGYKAKRVENTHISGKFNENQIWGGEILITGDTHINGDLTILPGTVVRFVVGDDVGWGNEIPPDGYNDLDPTRLKSYEIKHSDLVVNGKLIARGMPDKRIIFTSAATNPDYADWVGIYVGADRSIIEYSIVEWSRHGISLGRDTPNTVIRNNIINYTFWGSISSDYSSAQIYDNEIWESGHEGIDVQGGNPTIENNKIYNAHTGIVILSGSAIVKNNIMINVGNGVHTASGATPTMEKNRIKLASGDSRLEWSYGNFSYVMFGNPIIKR